MDLEGLGKAISEAIALRAKIQSVEDNSSGVSAQIQSNEKEITRLKSLEEVTVKLRVDKDTIESEASGLRSELSKRMEKLNKAGVKLPLEQVSVSSVSL